MGFEYGEDYCKMIVVLVNNGVFGLGVGVWGDEGLEFDENGFCVFDVCEDDRFWCGFVVFG